MPSTFCPRSDDHFRHYSVTIFSDGDRPVVIIVFIIGTQLFTICY